MNTKNTTKAASRFSHDEFFRKGMATPEVAREVIEMKLPTLLLDTVDLNTLKQIPETFVEKNLRKSIVDVLFSCHTKKENKEIFLYLLCEHQSTPDYWMSMRLWEYVFCICKRFREENPEAKKLPLVYPMVFYNGKTSNNEPRNFYELFDYPEIAKDILHSPFALHDLTKIADEELKKKIWGGTWLFFMKHAYERHIFKLIKQTSSSLKQIYDSKRGLDFLYSILCYNKVERLEKNAQQELSQLLTSITDEQTANNLMGTLAQSWLEEGEQKGIQKGRHEGSIETTKVFVHKMLKAGMAIKQISEITDLSINEIEALSKEKE